MQRKLLPKYLFVLDAVTTVHLLQCLVRLQPPAIHCQHSSSSPADQQQSLPPQEAVTSQQTVTAPHAAASRQHPQQGPTLDQLAQLPTSIYGAITGPQPGIWPAAPPTQLQQSAADAAAVARGFAVAAAARSDFEVMLVAVYSVLAVKLSQWPFAVLAKVVACAGQLQLQHQGFLQVRMYGLGTSVFATAMCVWPAKLVMAHH